MTTLDQTIDELAVSTAWSRRALNLWCMTARAYAKRKRMTVSDEQLAQMLRTAVDMHTRGIPGAAATNLLDVFRSR